MKYEQQSITVTIFIFIILQFQILAIILAILAIPGVMMNALVLWSLFCKIGNLNRPTRQLHGNMMFANTVLLLVCVPALS